MIWSCAHEEILCREIFMYEPFNHKAGTRERGEAWKLIAESLNSLDNPKFTVTQRAVREKYSLLEKSYKQKIRKEENASGITPDEPTELEKALEEIFSKFEDIELISCNEKKENSDKLEKERESASDMRQKCMETYAETKKRKGDNETPCSSTKRSRKSGDDTIQYLREKMKVEKDFRERELQLAETRENTIQQLLVQQQQQNQAMLAILSHMTQPEHQQ